MIPACPSLMCSFNRDNIEGTNFSKICVWCSCMSCMFYVGEVISFVDWLDRGLIYICVYIPEFDCPEVTLHGWQDIKIQLLLQLSIVHVQWCCTFSLSVSFYIFSPLSLCIYCDAESVHFVLVLLLIINAWVIMCYICSFDFDDWFVLQIFTWWAPYCIR